ncbi:MAG: TlpA family protein disulfide reductase [Acidobacteriia bacterium]|nr:TlpA family protein disulfide reductase [Terriglobia bacterium]
MMPAVIVAGRSLCLSGILLTLFLYAAACYAQPGPEAEQEALRQGLQEAGNSQVDFIRVLESHLFQYPQTMQRAELERTIVKAATEVKDNRRIVLYGERVLSREPDNRDLLDRVTRLLLAGEDKEKSGRALEYARRLEQSIYTVKGPAPGASGAAGFAENRGRALGRAWLYQSRAIGNLGKLAEAEALARRSYEVYPTAESAREIGRWLHRQGKVEEAIARTADAFAIADPAGEEADRKKDRKRLSEWKGNETGLGDLLLAAYDRTQATLSAKRAQWLALDPNAEAASVMQFTLTGLKGDKLRMDTLLGKVVVLDFWATWCGPCRAQQPLYEKVKERFKDNTDVVFLNINTDEDHSVVQPFLAQMKWNKTVYFEDGMSSLLKVTNIPMTLVVGRDGQIASRMNGYVEDRFVDMLSNRIATALAENPR